MEDLVPQEAAKDGSIILENQKNKNTGAVTQPQYFYFSGNLRAHTQAGAFFFDDFDI